MLITTFLKSLLVYLWYLKKVVYDRDSLIHQPCSLENINFQLINSYNNDQYSNRIVPYQNFPLFIARPSYQFKHGCASGDSSSISTIFWTRITPDHKVAKASLIPVYFQLSTDENFQNLLYSGITYTNSIVDFTIKLHIRGLEPNTIYHYKFYDEKQNQVIGKSRTLPIGLENLNLTITDVTKFDIDDLDSNFILQLNDYKNKLFTRLKDYRYRYAFEQKPSNITILYGSNPKMYHDEDFKLNDYTQALLEWFPIKPPKMKIKGKLFKIGDSLHISSDFNPQLSQYERLNDDVSQDELQFTELIYGIEDRDHVQIKRFTNVTNISLKDHKGKLCLKIDENGVNSDISEK